MAIAAGHRAWAIKRGPLGGVPSFYSKGLGGSHPGSTRRENHSMMCSRTQEVGEGGDANDSESDRGRGEVESKDALGRASHLLEFAEQCLKGLSRRHGLRRRVAERSVACYQIVAVRRLESDKDG